MSINSFNNEVFPLVMLIWATHLKFRKLPLCKNNVYLEPKQYCGLSRWLCGKESACDAGDARDSGSLGRKILWRRRWQPTPVFLPGKPHGQNSLVGYSPWGPKRVGTQFSD